MPRMIGETILMKNIKLDLVSLILVIIGIMSTAMLFFPALSFSNADSTFLGYEVVFGTEFVNLGTFSSGEIVWSILGTIAYLSPLIAALTIIFYKKGIIISLVLFILSTILLLTLPSYTKPTITIINTVTDIAVEWSFAYGLIIAATLSTLASILSLFKITYQTK